MKVKFFVIILFERWKIFGGKIMCEYIKLLRNNKSIFARWKVKKNVFSHEDRERENEMKEEGDTEEKKNK